MRRIKNFKSEIVKLNSLNVSNQSDGDESNVTEYNTGTWKLLNPNLKCLVKHLENKSITRKDVFEYYKSYFSSNSRDASLPFLVTMLWGFGTNGYGAYRTNKYFGTAENINLINTAFEELKMHNISNAYSLLMQIKGLNISYISKVLFFATKTLGIENYTLIFDIRVARALVDLEAGAEISKILNITPSDKFEDYERYNRLIHKTANELNVEADALEMFLFIKGGE